jgi:hypothetical protein
MLLVVLLQKNRASGITDKCAERGKAYVTGAVTHVDRVSEKG